MTRNTIVSTSVSALLMVRGQCRSALELLDKVIEDPLPLFQGEDWVVEDPTQCKTLHSHTDVGEYCGPSAWGLPRQVHSI